jgi:thiol-disulfide isomerase/thioredoxin
MSRIPLEGSVEAPDFPPHLEWLNLPAPISLDRLRGKIVLLDFWTYCCINCMHIIPDLKRLEAKYARELVVIGVHSAKFQNERNTANIRAAVARYEIEHPVVNDAGFEVWRSYGVRSWPTLVLISPKGRVIGAHSGEAIYDLFDTAIGQTVAYFDRLGLIDRSPLKLDLERDRQPPMILSFPGKVAADEQAGLLVISDSNHNRIVLAGLKGEIRDVAGDGVAGLRDGPFESARFFRPQGVFLDSLAGAIYVADTENHAIRRIDLKQRVVSTLCGDGRQASGPNRDGDDTRLNSPWDLIRVGDLLYIAMAGPHQLWSLDLRTLKAKVHAGSGREDIVDGALPECALAQPSGITTDGTKLHFADSEVSALRSADFAPDGRVETLIGEGLFEFGDIDGVRPTARLQHCIGVHYHDGAIYIADTYNHKVRRFDLKTRELTTFAGSGLPGLSDGPAGSAQLNEPNGLCFAGGRFLIADTNNHVVRVLDPVSNQLSTLALTRLERLRGSHGSAQASATVIRLEPHTVSQRAHILELEIALPEGMHLNLGLNAEAPSRVRVSSANAAVAEVRNSEFDIRTASVAIPVKLAAGETLLQADMSLYYCREGEAALCFYREQRLEIPLRVTTDGPEILKLEHRIAA